MGGHTLTLPITYSIPYRRRARWTNLDNWQPLSLCIKACGMMNANRLRERENKKTNSILSHQDNILSASALV